MALEDQQIRSVLEKVLSTETTITDESVIKLRRIMEKFIRVVARLGFERCLINTQDRCIDSDCIKQAIEILGFEDISSILNAYDLQNAHAGNKRPLNTLTVALSIKKPAT